MSSGGAMITAGNNGGGDGRKGDTRTGTRWGWWQLSSGAARRGGLR